MGFCRNCGRPLVENEVCSCTSGATQNPQAVPPQQVYQNAQQPYVQQPYAQQPYAQQPVQQPYAQQPYAQQPVQQPYVQQPVYMQAPPQQQKKSHGCLIAALIIIPIFLLVTALLAAILVPAMLGYMAKSKTVSANTLTRNISNSANAVLTDLDASDIDVKGTYIITSGFDSNVNVKIDATAFVDALEKYCTDAADTEYFVVVMDGKCVYAAAENKDDEKYIGSSPTGADANKGAARFDGTYPDDGKWSLDQYYNDACKAIAAAGET